MISWTTGICALNGIDVHYIRTGGAKPPVVLLHGLMTKGACWVPLAKALEKDFDVIMPDARGHGDSSAPEHGYHYDNLAEDVVGLIDTLGLDAPVLIGHSMGGMTAAVVASRYPNLLQGLVLADPTFLTLERQHEVYESDVKEQHLKILKQSKQELMASMRSRPKKRPEDVIEVFAEARLQTSPHAFEVLAPPNPDYMKLISTIRAPSVLIIGDDGAVVTLEVAKELARINPHLEVVQVEKAGHSVPFDQPDRFSKVVQTFLNSLSSAGNNYQRAW